MRGWPAVSIGDPNDFRWRALWDESANAHVIGNVGWRITEREGEGKYRSAAVTYQGSVARVEGRALVPGLRSHQRNTISIDPDKLPADATVPKVDLMAVPGNRDVDQYLRARLLM